MYIRHTNIMAELSDSLIAIGIPKPEALIIEFLKDHKPHNSREIEHELYLAQPVVSIAMRTIREFVKTTEQHNERGAPSNFYKMSKEQFGAYIQRISDEKENKLNNEIAALVKIREM
jgi:predicted transcriptional regulator